MNPTLHELARACREEPVREKLLFVPSYSIGHQIGEWLVRTNAPWANLRVTTPAGYAHERVAVRLSSDSIRLVESYERFLIVEKLCSDPNWTNKSVYFKSGAEVPGILKCLSDAIHEVRMAALDSGSVDVRAFVVPDKGQEFKELLAAYEGFLKEDKLIDHAGLLALAIEETDVGAPKDHLVMVLTDFPLTRLEKLLIDHAGQGRIIPIGHARPNGLALPRRFWAFTGEKPCEELETDIELLARLPSPADAPAPLRDASVSVFSALGESNEVREVFRRILSRDIRFDNVEIVVSESDPYISLVYEIAETLNIPITLTSGIPVTYSRPGRALLLWLKWVSSDFAQSYLIQLLSGAYLDFKGISDEREWPSCGGAAAIVREAAVGWGRERYPGRLKAIRESYLSRSEEQREEGNEEGTQRAQEKARKVQWVGELVDTILRDVPCVPETETLGAKQLYQAALNFLATRCRVVGELDAAAKSRMVDLLETLSKGTSVADSLEKLCGRVVEVVESLKIDQSNPKPGCVHVSHYRTGGWSGRSHTFVVGLDQGRFPGVLTQDPIILDDEREGLSPHLTLAPELICENSYLMEKMLTSLSGQVTLSFSRRDLIDDRELFPSPLVLNVHRLVTNDHSADYTALTRALGEPAGFVPSKSAASLNHWEWWLSEGRETSPGLDSIYSCYPFLFDGDRAESAREGKEITEYDGWVPSGKGDIDPFGPHLILSAKRLENLAKCPFAFFLENVLRIEPLDEMEKDPGRWLDPLQKGELLHEVFRKFMETISKMNERPSFQSHRSLVERIAFEEVERWKEMVPAGSTSALDREVRDILQTCSIFLKDEEERAGIAQPLLFEVSFGMPGDRAEGFSLPEPVEIRVGTSGTFRLRGRIDRVDRCGEHEYEVWDYKTGSAWGYEEHKYFNGGRQLQHVLYAEAAETILRKMADPKAIVVRAGYFFPSTKGEGLRIERRRAGRQELDTVLVNLFDLLRNGVFASSYDDTYCKYCFYGGVCGGTKAVERCQARIDCDARLRPLRELKEHA